MNELKHLRDFCGRLQFMPRSWGCVRRESLTSPRATHRLVNQLFYPPCMPSRTVGNVERDDVVRAGFKYIIRAVCLQIALVHLFATVGSVELGPIANLPPRVEVRFTGTRIIKTFQDDESSKTLDTSDRAFVDLIGVSETKATDGMKSITTVGSTSSRFRSGT